jgi:hypothetical protein
MTNDKLANTEAANDALAPVVDDRKQSEKPKKPVEDEKLESLSIDENDFGGDPYNHTGSFYVPKFDKNFGD